MNPEGAGQNPSAVLGKAQVFDKAEGTRKKRKSIIGKVFSDKMQKTRTVKVLRLEKHPKYGKYMRKYSTFYVHDEEGVSREGDTVLIAETRPLSRTKRWRLVKVVTKASGPIVTAPVAEDLGEAEQEAFGFTSKSGSRDGAPEGGEAAPAEEARGEGGGAR